jgi:hypothetical protein
MDSIPEQFIKVCNKLRKDLVTNVEVEDKPYPIEGLDFTCAPGRADLKLDYWIKK